MPDRDLQFFEHIAALKREGQSFAVAMVVSRRSPVSSHLGDRAVIFGDGRMQGFVGGACSREIVRKQALEALALGSPRLVQIRPDAAMSGIIPTAEHVVVPMSCASEGAADVYIEPYLLPALLLVVGFSPVAEVLVRAGQALEYEVVRVVTAEERGDLEGPITPVVGLAELDTYLAGLTIDRRRALAAVVASQGHYDELALEALLKVRPLYLSLLSSRKRGASAKDYLRDRGIAATDIDSIHNPAGLDLGGAAPPEVAVSILAQIVQFAAGARRAGAVAAVAAGTARATATPPGTATDPVCGMDVAVATALHTTEFDGVRYYFCGAGCKARFAQSPAAYIADLASAETAGAAANVEAGMA